MISTMKRYLYLSHRWLGIILCSFMALWFLSGVVMMYVGYPKQTSEERLGAISSLTADNCCIDFNLALSAITQKNLPDSVRITTAANSPRYIFGFGKQQLAVNATTGLSITAVSPEDAVAAAESYAKTKGHYQGAVNEDAWTHSRALDPHRPLHIVAMDDQADTWLYVSGVTGEVVRDATGTERIWNWIGAWLHWLYPFRGNLFQSQAANIVIYSSLGGSILALTGIIVGLLRWRFVGQYKSGSKSPYKQSLIKWHHLTGLIFGLTTFTWVLSGLFSVNPWKIFDSHSVIDTHAYRGGEFNATTFQLPIKAAINSFKSANFEPVEIELHLINGKGYIVGYAQSEQTKILAADGSGAVFDQFDWQQLESAAQKLLPNHVVIQKTIIDDYDYYYYARAKHTMSGHLEKRLPILRLEFDDPVRTWVQIDPYTGNFTKMDSYKRVSRFLFNFLHSWDWLVLLNNRPVWDVLLILFSLGGFLLSVTGTIVGWRRLRAMAF